MSLEGCFDTIGRRYELFERKLSDPFILDEVNCLETKSKRRLNDKAQTLASCQNSHVRFRGTHSDEVENVALRIAIPLGLNPNLVRPIAKCHDFGHTPYGHIGEKVISNYSGKKFSHNVFGVVLLQFIEKRGTGLNCCYETLEGILHHKTSGKDFSLGLDVTNETNVVRIADKIAYVFADPNDAYRTGHMDPSIHDKYYNQFGRNQKDRTKLFIDAVIEESRDKNHLEFKEHKLAPKLKEIRAYNFENFYNKIDEDLQEYILTKLINQFTEFTEYVPEFMSQDPSLLLALLTDTEAKFYGNLLSNSEVITPDKIRHFGIFEIMPYLKNKNIDIFTPDLNKVDFTYK